MIASIWLLCSLAFMPTSEVTVQDRLDGILSDLESTDFTVVAIARARLDGLDVGSIGALATALEEPLSTSTRAMVKEKLASILAGGLSNLDAAVIDFASARARARPGSRFEDSAANERVQARDRVEKLRRQLEASGIHLCAALQRHEERHGFSSSLVKRVHERLLDAARTRWRPSWEAAIDSQTTSASGMRHLAGVLPLEEGSEQVQELASRSAQLAIRQLESHNSVEIRDARVWLLHLGSVGQQALDQWARLQTRSAVPPTTRREWSVRNRLRVDPVLDDLSAISLGNWDSCDGEARLQKLIRIRTVHGEECAPTLVHLANHDSDRSIRRRSAEFLSLLGDSRGAKLLLTQRQFDANQLEEASRDAVLRAANSLRDGGDLSGALTLLEDLARRLTADAEVHHAIGIVTLRLRDLPRSIAQLSLAIALDPTIATAHYNLACALCLFGETDNALAALRSAVHNGYGDSVHTRQDRDLEAIWGRAEFEQILEQMDRN